jgi:hypothetical protein
MYQSESLFATRRHIFLIDLTRCRSRRSQRVTVRRCRTGKDSPFGEFLRPTAIPAPSVILSTMSRNDRSNRVQLASAFTEYIKGRRMCQIGGRLWVNRCMQTACAAMEQAMAVVAPDLGRYPHEFHRRWQSVPGRIETRDGRNGEEMVREQSRAGNKDAGEAAHLHV